MLLYNILKLASLFPLFLKCPEAIICFQMTHLDSARLESKRFVKMMSKVFGTCDRSLWICTRRPPTHTRTHQKMPNEPEVQLLPTTVLPTDIAHGKLSLNGCSLRNHSCHTQPLCREQKMRSFNFLKKTRQLCATLFKIAKSFTPDRSNSRRWGQRYQF